MNTTEALARAIDLLGSSGQTVAAEHLRAVAAQLPADPDYQFFPYLHELADDLMEMHEETGISLDGWVAARHVVEAYHGPIAENGA